jgi:hypothetical protein
VLVPLLSQGCPCTGRTALPLGGGLADHRWRTRNSHVMNSSHSTGSRFSRIALIGSTAIRAATQRERMSTGAGAVVTRGVPAYAVMAVGSTQQIRLVVLLGSGYRITLNKVLSWLPRALDWDRHLHGTHRDTAQERH